MQSAYVIEVGKDTYVGGPSGEQFVGLGMALHFGTLTRAQTVAKLMGSFAIVRRVEIDLVNGSLVVRRSSENKISTFEIGTCCLQISERELQVGVSIVGNVSYEISLAERLNRGRLWTSDNEAAA